MANFNLIKETAREKRISIRSLAQRAGITESQLHHIVKRGSTNTQTLETIAGILGIPVGTFFDNHLSPSEETSRIIELEKENSLLRELLAEKERTIKILIQESRNSETMDPDYVKNIKNGPKTDTKNL